jgi:hypothetical protein
MESHDSTTVYPEQAPLPTPEQALAPILQATPHQFPGHVRDYVPEHRHPARPLDLSYRLVVRTVLWVIAAVVFLGFALWWILT